MKGRKGHHHRHPRAEHKEGGKVQESPASGDKDWEKDKAGSSYTKTPNNVEDEAEERKEGGKVCGEKKEHHAGRKKRKSGGRTGCNMNPLSSAHAGTAPKGHKTEGNNQ